MVKKWDTHHRHATPAHAYHTTDYTVVNTTNLSNLDDPESVPLSPTWSPLIFPTMVWARRLCARLRDSSFDMALRILVASCFLTASNEIIGSRTDADRVCISGLVAGGNATASGAAALPLLSGNLRVGRDGARMLLYMLAPVIQLAISAGVWVVFMHGAFLRQALLLSRKSHAEQLEHRHTQFIKVCLVLGPFKALFAFNTTVYRNVPGAAPAMLMGTPAVAAGVILLLTPSARARQLTSNIPYLAAGVLLLRVVQDLLAYYWTSGGGGALLSLGCELFTGRLKHQAFAVISLCAASNTPTHHIAGIAFGLAAVPIFVSLLHMISIGTFNWHDTDSVLAPLGLIVNNGVFFVLQHWSRKSAKAYMDTHQQTRQNRQTTSLHVPAESLSADLLDCPPLLFEEEDNANNKHVMHVNVCIDNPRSKRRNLGSCPLPRQFRRANDDLEDVRGDGKESVA